MAFIQSVLNAEEGCMTKNDEIIMNTKY